MSVLYGVHDREGYKFPPVGGWCIDTVALSENPRVASYKDIRPDINWLVRLNWGYGSTGTIPELHEIDKYVDAASKYAIQSNAYGYIVANEVNHESERPNGVFITPQHYAECFSKTRNLIKQIDSKKRVIVAAMAPYHPTNMPKYLRETLLAIEKQGGADGIAIHAYARSHNPASITSDQTMLVDGFPQYNSFFTYRDALNSVPFSMRKLPTFITEFNPLPDWEDKNDATVQTAYSEINWWNQQPTTQKVFCLCLFRWKQYENQAWGIENKHQVLKDFNFAVQQDFQTPYQNAPEAPGGVFMPQVIQSTIETSEPFPEPFGEFERQVDPRALQRGVEVAEVAFRPGEAGWIARSTRWLDEKESQGRHHFYFDTLDENGNRLTGVKIRVSWPSGEHTVTSEAKPGEPWSANFPMSPSRNEYTAKVMDGKPSDVVLGVGMGADTPGGFNAGIHTSTEVIFQRVKAVVQKDVASLTEGSLETQIETSMDKKKVPELVHPVFLPQHRRITQNFGENPEDYKHFKVDGVPLRGHTGLDFATPMGSLVLAVDDGQVVEVGSDPQGYGLYVKLQHAWGQSLYAHLKEQLVSHGQRVVKGSDIGFSGNTGNSTGPHLHFAMRVEPFNRQDGWGGYTDPLPYLSGLQDAVTAPGVRESLVSAAGKTGLDWRLLVALAEAESSFNPKAQSSVGAMGLLQIMPATWAEWAKKVGAKDPYNAADNALVGATYLKWLLDYHTGNMAKALWSYNAGVGNVNAGYIPDETRAYAAKILFALDVLKRVNP